MYQVLFLQTQVAESIRLDSVLNSSPEPSRCFRRSARLSEVDVKHIYTQRNRCELGSLKIQQVDLSTRTQTPLLLRDGGVKVVRF